MVWSGGWGVKRCCTFAPASNVPSSRQWWHLYGRLTVRVVEGRCTATVIGVQYNVRT